MAKNSDFFIKQIRAATNDYFHYLLIFFLVEPINDLARHQKTVKNVCHNFPESKPDIQFTLRFTEKKSRQFSHWRSCNWT